MKLFVKLFKLSVFDLVCGGKFCDLLSHEVDIGLVLWSKALFFYFNFMEAFMKIFKFSNINISWFFYPV